MPTNVIMPALGVAQQTGTLIKWLKAEDQSVTQGEPLMEIETDKATVEIEAPASGILTNVIASPGDEVPVGNCIAVILAPGEVASAVSRDSHRRPHATDEVTSEGGFAAHGKKSPIRPPVPKGGGRDEGRRVPSTPAKPANSSSAPITGRILASPAAKRIARERGVDLAALVGSGPQGSVLAEDVLRASPDGSLHRTAISVDEIVPLTAMRRIVGERMTLSKQTAPHFYLSMDIDMGAVEKLRAQWKARGDQLIPSINDFILLASARALKDVPSVNATYTNQGVKLHRDINIGMAVALDEGLVVPVMHNADCLKLTEMAIQSRELIDKAQKKKLFPLDYEGGTFTVSNLGMLGVDSFVAIINPPQCAILAVGRVAPRVVVDDGMFAIKSLMTAALSADHRVIDGAIGARFLGRFKQYLEQATST
jgi:pyruvate dehydrogenase E2 component (dihydrolipoamide acetyltransferase)